MRFYFLTTCLATLTFNMAIFAVFVDHFSVRKDQLAVIERLKSELSQERFSSKLTLFQFKDFQESVALALPARQDLQFKSEQLRGLASIVRPDSSESKFDLSGVYFKRGKKYFKEREYSAAMREFERVLNLYPLSMYTIESNFFLTECLFLLKDYKKTLQQIDKMVLNYPDHELTGFSLLRMGQISEIHHQIEEATEIYKTVGQNFKDQDLIRQAKLMAENIEYR